MVVVCEVCGTGRAQLRRPRNGARVCAGCFFELFEAEIHQTITDNQLFQPGDRVAIGASGGKDSTVLIHVLTTLNRRYHYGLDLILLSIDEGIRGYRDDSLATVHRNKEQYGLPLEALDRGAARIGARKIVTGHNADDVAETVLMNLLRGDIARLGRCVDIVTGQHDDDSGGVSRCKPFKYAYEKEIVLYAYLKRLDYFSTECTYAPQAYRGFAREYIKKLERADSGTIINIIRSAERWALRDSHSNRQIRVPCSRCAYMTSSTVCKACQLVDGLNRGRAKLALCSDRVERRAARQLQQQQQLGGTGPEADAAVDKNPSRSLDW